MQTLYPGENTTGLTIEECVRVSISLYFPEGDMLELRRSPELGGGPCRCNDPQTPCPESTLSSSAGALQGRRSG